MANQPINDPVTYSEVLRLLETTDLVHKDTFNPLFARLINNDAFIKAFAEQLANDIFAGGFVVSGMTSSKNAGIATQLDVTSGICYVQQSSGGILRFTPAADDFATADPSTTYYLDFQPDGTYSWGTAHSAQANYIPVAEVATDVLGQINTVTDRRTVKATDVYNLLMSHLAESATETALGHIKAPTDENGNLLLTKNSVGLGNVENYGIATQIEAESGTATDKYMTPQRVAQAIDKALSPGTVTFTSSTTWIVPTGVSGVDVFLVGGGGGGSLGGGGGGYTATFLDVPVTPGQSIPITVGAGGSGGSSGVAGGNGGYSQFNTSLHSANGGVGGLSTHQGGAGGSGGGGFNSGVGPGHGGSDGSNGVTTTYTGGTGQATTTRAFGDVAGTLYAGGGGGGSNSSSAESAGTGGAGGGGNGGTAYQTGHNGIANTGGGGGGTGNSSGSNGGTGGSGVVIVRCNQ